MVQARTQAGSRHAEGDEVMDARKKIDEYLRPILTEVGRKPVHDLLDEYAHELAEKIREAHEKDWWDLGSQDFDAHDAADLIDPKVAK